MISKWVNDNGDYTHRLNYKLDENSIVFDIGGYRGWFTEQINNKFGSKILCFEPIPEYANAIRNRFLSFENIKVFTLAISDKNEKSIIYINNDSSSTNIESNNPIEIECITLDEVMNNNNIQNINLIKINIEGDEYPLLEYMLKNNLIEKCENIQIQFHNFIDNYKERYNSIILELNKTHHLTYHYEFIWENWQKNN